MEEDDEELARLMAEFGIEEADDEPDDDQLLWRREDGGCEFGRPPVRYDDDE